MTDTTAVPVPAVFPGVEAPAEPAEEQSFRGRVAAVAHYLDSLRGTTGRRGTLAELRRISPEACALPPEAFWDVVLRFGIPEGEEKHWRWLLPMMAVHRHDPSRSPGAALEKGGVTPARLERWLRAAHEDARTQAPRVLARLGDSGVNWLTLAVLLRDWKPEHRTRVARDFFRSRHCRTSANQGA